MSRQFNPNKILVIIGPTASGKSSLAIEMARKYNGEIISADSRQIYRGMDIGTGKVEQDSITCHPVRQLADSGSQKNTNTPNNQEMLKQVQHDNIKNLFLSEGIQHHLIDIREPNEDYNVVDFKQDTQTLIKDIQSRDKLPIICGGTLFWAQALIDNQSFPAVPPNLKLREELTKLSLEELFTRLKALDPERTETIDAKNSVRLIRAIEIATILGKVPVLPCHPVRQLADSGSRTNTNTLNNQEILNPPAGGQHDNAKNYFIIAINPPKEILDAKIKKRLDERFDQGMIEEVQHLHDQGIAWERLEALGLEYRWIALFLQKKIDEETMREKLYFDIIHYAKRQLTWLRRFEKQGADIHWIQDASEIDTLL